jgi:hypothetical protein
MSMKHKWLLTWDGNATLETVTSVCTEEEIKNMACKAARENNSMVLIFKHHGSYAPTFNVEWEPPVSEKEG